jgi:hypothetical protein
MEVEVMPTWGLEARQELISLESGGSLSSLPEVGCTGREAHTGALNTVEGLVGGGRDEHPGSLSTHGAWTPDWAQHLQRVSEGWWHGQPGGNRAPALPWGPTPKGDTQEMWPRQGMKTETTGPRSAENQLRLQDTPCLLRQWLCDQWFSN